jgi:hypothetical protein
VQPNAAGAVNFDRPQVGALDSAGRGGYASVSVCNFETKRPMLAAMIK